MYVGVGVRGIRRKREREGGVEREGKRERERERIRNRVERRVLG